MVTQRFKENAEIARGVLLTLMGAFAGLGAWAVGEMSGRAVVAVGVTSAIGAAVNWLTTSPLLKEPVVVEPPKEGP